jgi:hypothetical protein
MLNPENKEPQFGDVDVGNVQPEGGLTHGIPPEPRPRIPFGSAEAAKRARLFQETKAAALENELLARQKKEERVKNEQEVKPLSWKERGEKLDEIVAQIAAGQRATGLPVGPDGRIDINYFEGKPNFSSSVIDADRKMIERLSYKYKGQEASSGEQAEKTIYTLFSKFLPDCEIVRTSIVDDEDINYDRLDCGLFIEGKLICAFDVVCTSWNKQRVDGKEIKVRQQNTTGGAGVKYCFEKNGAVFTYKSETNVPVFNIRVDPKLFDNINFSQRDSLTKSEMDLICETLGSIYDQIEELKTLLREGKIKFDARFDNEDIFRKRLESLEAKLNERMSPAKVKEYLKKPEFVVTRHFLK